MPGRREDSWASDSSARPLDLFPVKAVKPKGLESTAYAEAARRYREWSAKTWNAVTDERQGSQGRRNAEFRENLGAIETFVNPYDSSVPVELPTQYKQFGVDRQGNILGRTIPAPTRTSDLRAIGGACRARSTKATTNP